MNLDKESRIIARNRLKIRVLRMYGERNLFSVKYNLDLDTDHLGMPWTNPVNTN